MSTKICIIILLASGFLVYANALPNQFVWDDEEQIVNNALLRDAKNLPQILSSSTFQTGGAGLSGGFYRPVVSFSYLLNYQIWGPRPWAFRLFQLLFHLANVVLLFLFLRKLLAMRSMRYARGIAFAASLLFAVHPVNVESVAYIASVGEVLYSFFLLLALVVFLGGVREQERRVDMRALCAAIFFGLLGMLSKENAIVIFPLLALHLFLFVKPKISGWGIFAIGGAGMLAFYFFLRFAVAGISIGQKHIAPIARADFWERIQTIPYELFIQLKTLFFPAQLLIYRHFVVESVSDIRFWGPILFFAAVAALVIFVLMKHGTKWGGSLAFFAGGWFVISIVPTLNIIPLDMSTADRWLYFPSIGIFFLVSLFGGWLAVRSGIWRGAMFAVLILAAAGLSVRTIARNYDWRSGLSLYEHDIKYLPGNANLENNYGVELFRVGRKEEAEIHFRKSVELEDGWEISHNNLGAALEGKGDLEGALAHYLRSIEIGDYYLAYENEANILLRMKKYDEAKKFLEEAVLKLPRNSHLNLLLAAMRYRDGEEEKALSLILRLLQYDPANARAQQLFRTIQAGGTITF